MSRSKQTYSPWRHEQRTLDVSAAAMCLAVVADTHSRPHPALHRCLKALKPDAILHAGDIGCDSVIDELAAIAPTIAVRGNIDGHERPDSIALELREQGQLLLRILLLHIAVYGPRLRKEARVLARRHHAEVVVCGHSHVPLLAEEQGLWVFNPGSVGPRRFQLPITLGAIELQQRKLGLRHIDCASGRTWRP